MKITIKGIVDEDVVNYKKTSMTILFPRCTFKCEKESGTACCHNSELAGLPDIKVSVTEIVERYLGNKITNAIVCAGLEPLDSIQELFVLVYAFRAVTNDDIVIYTGYKKDEKTAEINALKKFKNIIVKYGRFIPNANKRYDYVIGVTLASDNQIAERIS